MTLQEILLLFNLRLVKDERVGAGKMEQNMKASEEENSPRQQKTSDCKENYINIANRLGKAEIINGNYQFYNRYYELLEQLTNEDIKRVVNKYINENNVYAVELELNTHKKRWYFQFMSFIAHNTFMRFWNPFVE